MWHLLTCLPHTDVTFIYNTSCLPLLFRYIPTKRLKVPSCVGGTGGGGLTAPRERGRRPGISQQKIRKRAKRSPVPMPLGLVNDQRPTTPKTAPGRHSALASRDICLKTSVIQKAECQRRATSTSVSGSIVTLTSLPAWTLPTKLPTLYPWSRMSGSSTFIRE